MSKVFEALQRMENSGGLTADLTEIQNLLKSSPPVQKRSAAPPEEPEAPAQWGAQPSLFPDHASVEAQPQPQVREISPRTVPVRISSESPVFPFDQNLAKVAEQYRIIRTKIVQHPLAHRVIAICSAGPGDGKTVTSINLASALALKSDTRVLLIEADLRRGSMASHLGTPATPGLSDFLTGTVPLHEAIVQTEQLPNLEVLVGGSRMTNPGEVLDSPQWRGLIQQVRHRYDYIIIDTPPIGLVADCDLIQAVSDGLILVARVDHTARSRCTAAIAKIVPERLIGVVLNCVDDAFGRHDGDYYGYQPLETK